MQLDLPAGSRHRRVWRPRSPRRRERAGAAGVGGGEDDRRSAASPTNSNVCPRRRSAAGTGPPSGAEPQRPAALGPVGADEPPVLKSRVRPDRRGRRPEKGAAGASWGGGQRKQPRETAALRPQPARPPLSPTYRATGRSPQPALPAKGPPPSRAPHLDSHWPALARAERGRRSDRPKPRLAGLAAALWLARPFRHRHRPPTVT